MFGLDVLLVFAMRLTRLTCAAPRLRVAPTVPPYAGRLDVRPAALVEEAMPGLAEESAHFYYDIYIIYIIYI